MELLPKFWVLILFAFCFYQCSAKPKSICMPDLDCFNLDEDFLSRSGEPLPQHRNVIQTTFLLRTRTNRHLPFNLNSKNVGESYFNASNPTIFIIHGFIDNINLGNWMTEMTDAFLNLADRNVIITDWRNGNIPLKLSPISIYIQAAANTRVVGAEIAFLIQELEKQVNLRPQDCHIVGHSLGAQAAGFAGKRVANLGRITGLDPSKPRFEGTVPTIRLDRSDALFVDIIHSDSQPLLQFGFGMFQAIGHVDFYPNNGKNQPGCPDFNILDNLLTKGVHEVARRLVACNHQRSIDFFVASLIYPDCQQVAYNCHSWDHYQTGQCSSCKKDGSGCAIMGFRAIEYAPFIQPTLSLKFYNQPGKDKSFCLHQYLVTLKMFRHNKATQQTGILQLAVTGTKGSYTFSLPKGTTFYPGSEDSFMIQSPNDLGTITHLSLYYESSRGIVWSIFSSQTLHVEFVKLTPMNVIDEEEKNRKSSMFCAKYGEGIQSKNLLNIVKSATGAC